MKKYKHIMWAAAILSVLMLEAACGNGPVRQNSGNGGQFRVRNIRDSVLLDPERKGGGPRMNFDINVLEVPGSRETADFFSLLLYEGRKTREYRESIIGMYRSAYREMDLAVEGAGESSGGPATVMDWEYGEYLDLETFAGRWLVLCRVQDSFTGGAHGISQKTYYVVDRKDLRALKWDEFFADPQSPELYGLILEALRERGGLEKNAPLSSGIYFEDEPAMSSDFFLNRDGLGFHWNPYEIGPYSEGHIEALIPWGKLEPLLSEYGREILKAVNS
jgi:hypothetical protein